MVFFAEIAFIYGGNDSLEKDVFGSEKSSEKIIKSSETTAISSGTGSGTHPHKVLGQAKRQRRAWGQPYNRDQEKNIQEFDLSVIFARKLQKSHLKMG